MYGSMDLYQSTPGFNDPELGTQQTFRAIVKALDYPGHLVQIKSKLSVPGILNPASAAIFLTLGNDETSVWADLNWNFPLIEWFQYQCGCSIVTEPCMASLALITKPITMPPLDHFRIGDEEQPGTSVTLIVQVGELSVNAVVSAIGPVENKMATRTPMVEPVNLWDHWYQHSNLFSLGVDIFLTCDDILTALPHSIR